MKACYYNDSTFTAHRVHIEMLSIYLFSRNAVRFGVKSQGFEIKSIVGGGGIVIM